MKSHSKMITQEPYQFVIRTSSLPVIHCRCGAEILVVPDVKAMGIAIDAHVEKCRIAKHRRNITECIADIDEYLTLKALNFAAETEL
jgi:hypothetical protein